MIAWRQWPFFRLILPFGLGIGCSGVLPYQGATPFWAWPIMLLSFTILFFYGRRVANRAGQWFFGIGIWAWLLMAGLLRAQDAYPPTSLGRNISVREGVVAIARVEYCDQPKGRSMKCRCRLRCIRSGRDTLSGKSALVDVYTGDSLWLSSGSMVRLRGRLLRAEAPSNPGAFDYRKHLARQGVGWQFFAWRTEVLQYSDGWEWDDWRKWALGRLEKGLHRPSSRSIVAALVLGDRSQLDDRWKSVYSRSGTMHVLAVSGLHVGLVAWMIQLVLARIIPRWVDSKRIIGWATIFCIWVYAGLTGLGASVFRSAVMFSLLVMGQQFPGRTHIWNSLAAAAFCLLCLYPLWLFQLGFQLSFLAVIGIVYWYPVFQSSWYPPVGVLRYLWRLTCVGLAAQMTTFPLTMYHFGQFPILFWATGWVALPAAGVILGLGLSKLFLGNGLIAEGLAWLLDVVVYLLNRALSWTASLDFAVWEGIGIGRWEVVGIYSGLLGIMACRHLPKYNGLSGWLGVGVILVLVFTQQRNSRQHHITAFTTRSQVFLEITRGQTSYRLHRPDTPRADMDYSSRGFHQKRGITRLVPYMVPDFALLSGRQRGKHWAWWRAGQWPEGLSSSFSMLVVDGDFPPPPVFYESKINIERIALGPGLSPKNRILWQHYLQTIKRS